MSIDSYFCFCCLSSNELTSMYSSDSNKSYAKMLEYVFSFKPLLEDHETDCYICQECICSLEDVNKFKTQVYQTLSILQKQGLIELQKNGAELFIKWGFNHTDNNDNKSEAKDEKTDVVSTYEVKVKNEEEQSFDTSKNKCSVTAIITQPMIKVNVGPQVYDTEVSGHSCNGAKALLGQTYNKNQPVESLLSVNIIEEDTGNKMPIKNEQDKDAIVEAVKSERKEMVVETNMNRIKSYEVTEDLTCKLCAKKLPNLYVYHTHMNGHMPHHICETCGKGFPNPVKLRRHIYSHQKGPFVCESCGETFTNYNTYCAHKQRNHSTTEQYACPQCTDRFRTFSRRARHLQDVHGIQYNYTCPECGKNFLVAGTLSTHMRHIHWKVKRHICVLCDAAFFLQQDLVAHVGKAHGGEHAHMCAECGKRFPRKKALKVHMRIHNNDRPFGCALCDKKFTQKCALVAHVRVHTREKKHRGKAKTLEHDTYNNQGLIISGNNMQNNEIVQ